jgi:Na+/H+ antiporter NhaD/arsenite permease-like protein
MTWLAVGVFVVAYGLIASDKVSRVAIALAGAAVLLLAVGVLGADDAFFSDLSSSSAA